MGLKLIIDEWKPFTRELLGEESADVWRIDLPQFYSQEKPLTALLSTQELAQSRQFLKPLDQTHYAIIKGISRLILSLYLDQSPKEITFDKTKTGKPIIPKTTLYFNLSHSRDRALLIVGRSYVGVDIEFERDNLHYPDIINRFFSEDEKNQIASLKGDLKPLFFQAWVKKEAFVKATGDGLSFPLSGFTVDCDPAHDDNALLAVHNTKAEASNWKIISLHVTDNGLYHAAACVESNCRRMRCYDFVL